MKVQSLLDIHRNLCHPGVSRLAHYVRNKNLPYSMEKTKKVCKDSHWNSIIRAFSRGPCFISAQLKEFLRSLSKSIKKDLRTKQLPVVYWENSLQGALLTTHALLRTATNLTPNERFLGFSRKSSCQSSIPPCLPIGTSVIVKRHNQGSKFENNQFSANVQYQSGHWGRVSITDLAPTDDYTINEEPDTQSGTEDDGITNRDNKILHQQYKNHVPTVENDGKGEVTEEN
ncbi:hypothetical protein GJ496_008111 [Pomphorhynchus laevis]|nr:hypothetical protein GJ496_008111 [Pomphorhynchus laevis]